MTILIKGMEMPKSCSKCWFVEFTMREYKPCYQCYLTRETASEQDFERRGIRNCPLVEVPTPHGRLIDARVLQRDMMDMVQSGLYGLEDMIDAVIEAHTVIEVEK